MWKKMAKFTYKIEHSLFTMCKFVLKKKNTYEKSLGFGFDLGFVLKRQRKRHPA